MTVDSMVRLWISLTVEDKYDTHDGLGMAVGRCMSVFYVDDVMIRSRELEWLQGANNILIVIFRRVGLMANVEKYKTMNCHMGEICTGIS